MDTIGIDENRSPVSVEYMRSTNENVSTRGCSAKRAWRRSSAVLGGWRGGESGA